MPFCTQCGHENPEQAKYCSQCGSKMQPERPVDTTTTISFGSSSETDADRVDVPELTAADAAAIDALPPESALLVVQRGPSAGSRFLLDTEEVTAGRHPDSDIFLDDVTVSRRHVEFRRGADGRFSVADVGSLNGTYVNRERIDSVALVNGDEVQIGKYRLVFYPSQRI